MAEGRWTSWMTWLAGGVPLALFVFTMPQGTYWLDSPELATAAMEMGVAHPPGQPLYLTLARLISLVLPLGTLPFRLNLLSALLGGLSAALFFRLARALLCGPRDETSGDDHARRARWWRDAAALVAAWAFSVGHALWLQSQRAEVYTLNLALLLLTLSLVLSPDRRAAAIAGLCFGLGLANHHYLMVLCAPAIAVAAWPRHGWRGALRFGAAAAGGLLVYGHVLARGRLPSLINWARPGDLRAFWEVLTAKVFQGSVGAQVGGAEAFDPFSNLGDLGLMLLDDMSVVGLVAALTGLFALARRLPRAAATLGLLFAAGLAAKGVMEVDPLNPDDHGYLLPALAGLYLGGAAALAALLDAARQRGTPVAAGLLTLSLVGVVSLGARRLPARDLSDFDAPDRVHAQLVASLPLGATCLPYFYPLHFLATEKLVVEGVRPDLAVLHQSLGFKVRRGVDYARDMSRRYPALTPALTRFIDTGAWDPELLDPLSTSAALFFEPSLEPVVPPMNLIQAGWWFRYQPASAAQRRPSAPPPLSKELLAWTRRDRATRMVLTHLAYASAMTLRMQGREQAARGMLERLEEVLPGSTGP